MINRIYITGVKIFAIAMLMYSGYLCFRFMPLVLGLIVGLRQVYNCLELSKQWFGLGIPYPFKMVLPLITVISLLSVTLLIASIGILRLKKWARVVGLYSSCIAIIVSFVVWLVVISLSRCAASMVPLDIEQLMLESFYAIFIYLTLPALFSLVFVTRREIKQCFEKEVIQESKGVTILVTLLFILILPCIFQNYEPLASNLNIPEPYLNIWFWLDTTICIIAVCALLGLFTLRDVFRKIAIAAILCDLVLSFPLPYFINTSEIPYTVFVIIFIVYTTLEVTFIYFLTRPKVKEQFQKTQPWVSSTTLFHSIFAKCPT
ncbi:MAG: hypothetical protein A2173_02770 [Planctomycetes bacterium RBG_13_44_8b]|nr:MAG: hypothetical protein A2173_02770 [Planctomycetes bacterium RBG_13_44_8b]